MQKYYFALRITDMKRLPMVIFFTNCISFRVFIMNLLQSKHTGDHINVMIVIKISKEIRIMVAVFCRYYVTGDY